MGAMQPAAALAAAAASAAASAVLAVAKACATHSAVCKKLLCDKTRRRQSC
jgi:hypothetical protein